MKGKALAITGIIFQIVAMLAPLGTFLGMDHASAVLHSSPNGISDPRTLATSIGNVLIVTAAGLAVGLVGLVLLCVALVSFHYRAEWFFWFLVIYSVLLIFAFPIGTVCGIFFLLYCLTRRDEFLCRTQPANNP